MKKMTFLMSLRGSWSGSWQSCGLTSGLLRRFASPFFAKALDDKRNDKGGNNIKWARLLLLLIGLMGVGSFSLVSAEDTVNVRIEGESVTVFDGEAAIGVCEILDKQYEAVAACALEAAAGEAGVSLEWQDFGFGLLLAQIGEERNADDWSKTWGFWVDYDPASVGLSDYSAAAGEEILVAYTGWPGVPLRVTGPESVSVDDEVQLMLEQRSGEYDDLFNWMGDWEAAAGLLVSVGGQEFVSDDDGMIFVSDLAAGEWSVKAEGTGNMIRSREWMLNVLPMAAVSPVPTAAPTPEPSATSIPTIVPTVTPVPSVEAEQVSDNEMRAAAVRALTYLRTEQDSEGGIDGGMVSGWTAMAFGADNIRASEVKTESIDLADYLTTVELVRVTDKERQIMALRAGGINPRNWQGRDLIGELKDELKGKIGVDEYINDEVFGVLALMAGEVSVDDVLVRDLVGYLADEQAIDGSWETIDMTAATVQAIQSYRVRGGSVNEELLDKARTFLRNKQDINGVWGGNSATTAWVMMAIKSMGEDQNDWVSEDGMTPGAALLKYQAGNGGFGWQSDFGESAFMTAYAVPALLGKSWVIASLSVETSEFYVEEIERIILTPHPNPLLSQGRGDARAIIAGAQMVAGVIDEESRLAGQASFSGAGNEQRVMRNEDDWEIEKVQRNNAEPVVPVNRTDRGFLWVMFGLANAGVGGTITRLVMKII